MTAPDAPSRTVLVTGAGGFVGQALLPCLRAAGWRVHTAGRAAVGDIGPSTDWRPFLDGANAVVHLAARVHVMRDEADDPETEFDWVNHRGTARLAEQAVEKGIRRFVFLSSVKVHGDASDHALTGDDPPAPNDAYGRSKLAAERALAALAGPMQVTVLRPPLVYGPGVKGNFLTMLKAVDRGWPLPLAAIENRRSLIYAGNLADAIRTALDTPAGTYLPSDRDDVSTPALIRRLAAAMDRRARLFPVPPALLRALAGVAGKAAAVERLTGSLTVDGAMPGWQPPFGMSDGLAATAAWYRAAGRDGVEAAAATRA
jgi:nucleoside-diphosphate-sugar epimerase